MPRGGSKKGERRGNAKKRPEGAVELPKAPRKPRTKAKPKSKAKITHETREQVMRDSARKRDRNGTWANPHAIERRLELSRVIVGDRGAVQDMTPKEVILDAMWYFKQASTDWKRMLGQLAALDQTRPEVVAAINKAESEIERYELLASDRAYQVMPIIHPRLAAVAVTQDTGANQETIVEQLLNDIDERQRMQRPMKMVHELPAKSEDA